MARSMPQALIRPYGFALLRPASPPQLDSARILTLSGTLAINLIAMGLLMMPLAAPTPAVWVEPTPVSETRWFKKPLPPIEVVNVVKPTTPPLIKPVARPVAASNKRDDSVAAAVVSDTGAMLANEGTAIGATGPVIESIAPVPTGPAPVQLEYARAPAPTYPRNAQRLGLTGTVMLQVLVGIDGRPLEVSVVQSSGHRELDETARAQVLKRWSFRPATKDGIAIQAMGLVPVQFSLQR
ncbi:MAG: TonB family protein [Pseudomonadota bacterium]|nr:TonB family protein [Pseudomonadota bacterium]